MITVIGLLDNKALKRELRGNLQALITVKNVRSCDNDVGRADASLTNVQSRYFFFFFYCRLACI